MGQQGQGQNQPNRDRDSTSTQQRQGQGQVKEGQENRSNTSVSLSTEERTKIREVVVKERSAPRVEKDKINFSLNVGTAVPRTVHIVEVPQEIIRIHPAWRGFKYFLVGDEIVIVEPDTLKIVAIIPA
jgi:hypothetical protein